MVSRVSIGRPSVLIQLSANASYNQEILSDRMIGVGKRLHGAIENISDEIKDIEEEKLCIPASWLPTAE